LEGTPTETPDGSHLVKMHSCGNDYIFLDAVGGPALPDGVDIGRLTVELSDRHFGVGGDGLIIIERRPSGRLGMRMHNADGSEGEMCGNGVRCLAAYAWRQGYVAERRFEVETRAGIIIPEILPTSPGLGDEVQDLLVRVDMGPPREIRPLVLEVSADSSAAGIYRGVYVSMGNPHFVIVVSDIADVNLEMTGPVLERHPAFPDRANIEFVEVLAPDRLRMRIWERGSGLTLGSGTGASASLVAAASAGLTGRQVTAIADGGELVVEWAEDGPVWVTGVAVEVFRTIYNRRLPSSG
jgi:diaminopimelate epimerase